MPMQAIDNVEVTLAVAPEKYDLYIQADNLIAERLGRAPGPETLMAIIAENEEDPVVLAELYCAAVLESLYFDRPQAA